MHLSRLSLALFVSPRLRQHSLAVVRRVSTTQCANNPQHADRSPNQTKPASSIRKMSAQTKAYSAMAESLNDDIIDSADPSAERANDVLRLLEATAAGKQITVAVLSSTNIGKFLTKTVKACKRHKRTSADKEEWDTAIAKAEALLASFKEAASAEAMVAKKRKADSDKAESKTAGLPKSAAVYRSRLTSQSKEMYKDPPAMPPAAITIEDSMAPAPKRNKTTGELTFVCGEDDGISSALKDFRPNRTPEEVLRAGSFGGTYYRPIASAVTNVRYSSSAVLKDSIRPEWIEGLNKSRMITNPNYDKAVNKFGVKCGGSLGMWESSGWISDSDPYGWFQWYCRFYQGRRCSDDSRQISRWLKSAGPKGRFRSQLCNKILAAGTSAGDTKISPVIRQTLLHWGLEVTEHVVEKHKNRVK